MSHEYEWIGEDNATKVTRISPEDCTPFFQKAIAKWKLDPNNIIYDYPTHTEQKLVQEPAEFHIWKRRQRTKAGSVTPQSPCDDKGLPLFTDAAGNVVTKPDGNTVLWGSWADGSKDNVSILTKTIPERCWATRIERRWGLSYPRAPEAAEADIQYDKQLHEAQQRGRKTPVAVDYKVEKVKDATEFPEWHCRAEKQKAREFPPDWVPVSFHAGKEPLIIPDPSEMRRKFSEFLAQKLRSASSEEKETKTLAELELKAQEEFSRQTDEGAIIISFKSERFDERKRRMVPTGVGNFAGRQEVVKDLKNGQVYGLYALMTALAKHGFQNPVTGWSDYPSYFLDVPNSDYTCEIQTSRLDIPFFPRGTLKRLRSPDGKIPLGGHFNRATFHIGKPVDTTHLEYFRWRKYGEGNYYRYENNAPATAVNFCHAKFRDVIRNSIVKLEEDLPAT